MPQTVLIDGVGEVEFPDDLAPQDIQTIIERDILKSVIQATPAPAPEEAVSDNLLGRFAGALSENAAIVTQGAGRVLQQTPMYRALQLGAEAVGLGEYGPSSNIDKLTGFAREVQAQSRPSYGVTTSADTLVEQVVEGAASLPTVIAAGPAAPAVNAVLMGESRLQEAQQYAPSTLPPFAQKAAFDGRALTPEEQEQVRQYQAQAEIKNRQTEEAAFGLAGALGFGSEWALGIPAMLKGGGGRRLLDTIGLGIAREGTQEGVDEFGGNVIAKGLYDPDRDVTEGVKESITVGGILGAPLGPLMQGPREGAPVAPEAPDLIAVASVLEDTDQPDLTGFGSAARESIPPPLPPSPTEQVSATVLGKDVTELRQQEAIATGQPVPEINEGAQTSELAYGRALDPYDAFAGVQQAPESSTPEAVEAPLAPEEGQDTTQTPEGLVAVDPDTYERLADEPVQDGFVAYQDEATDAIFQVPANATPEQVQEAVVAARQENTEATYKLIEQQVAEEAAILRGEREQLEAVVAKQPRTTPSTRGAQIDPLEKPTQDDFKTFPADPTPEQQAEMRKLEEQGWESEKLPSGNTRMVSEKEVYRKDLLSGEAATKVWTDVDRLKFILDRMEMNLAKAKKGNLEDAQGQPVMPDELEAGVKKLRRRYNFLKKRVASAQQQMNRKKDAGEQGGTAIPQAAFELGQAIYRKGMAFKDWSAAMIRQLGAKIRPFLADLWSSVVSGVDSLSPAGRRFKRSGSVGRQSPQEVYDVFSDDLRGSKADTKPNEDFGEADKQAVRDAYAELQAETGFAGVSIADVMERAGFPLTNQSKGLLMQMYRDGEITSLNMGDWSLSDSRKRAWGVRNNGDIFLTVTMPQGMRRSAPSPEGGALGGQGGRRQPQPPPLPATDEQRTFSVMNAKTDEARVKMGLPPAMAPARITFGAVWDEAMAIIAQNPDAGQELTTSLALRPRVITPVESAILTHESIRLDTAYERALDVVNQSATEGELEANRNKMNRIGEEAQILFDVTRSVGTLAGQNLAARKLLVNQDLTLARMVKQTRAAQNGQPLSEKQQKDIEELHKKLKATEDELKRLQEKESKQEAANTFSAMMKELKADRKEAVKSGKTVTDFLNEQAEKARERLRSKMARTSAGVDPTILVDVAIIGASHIANGINTAAEFANRIVQEFGEEFRPYIPEIFKQSQEFHDANSKAFNVETKTPTQPTPQEILKEATTELDPRVVFELARAYVRSGMTKMEEVMDRIHQDLLPLIPGLEVRDVRDAFSGYGKVTYPSKAEDLVKLREMKVLARLTSQLEDVLRRQAPLRTGPQRDKLTADARILQKQINDLMRKYNIRSVDPLQQLKTSREAVKARLRNEIEELEKAITTRTQRPQGRTPVEPDEETKALQARRDKLRERYEELFPRAGLTPEQRIQQTLTALDKAISEETQMLRDGILKRPPKAPGVTSPEIENKQMELDALRQLRRELFAATQPRKAPEDIALEQAVKAAEASIKRMDEMLKSGNLSPAARARRFTPTAELEALWSERDAMRDALQELRKAEKPRKDPEEIRRKATIKALEKSIAMLDGRILSGDFSTTPQKANRPEVKEVAELREIRDQMRKTFNDLKKASTPTRSPEEIALERDKKNIRKRITQLQEKLAKGDYSTAPKKEPVMDREKRQLQYDYQKLREEYLKGVNEARMKAQNPVMKGIRVAGEVINTSRAILTSMDFSGVLRQGGFIVFGNPARAMRSFPAMFKAFGSEKGAFEVKEDIRKRDNYPLYQASKLYLADDAPASLNQMEEAFMSRWANRIPFVAGSQRAYVTFLNKLRADSFDAMIEGFATGGKPTLEESRVIANFINVATGRGSLGSFSGAGAAMNTVFFAPRYVVSRFQLLAGQPFYGGNTRTRKAIAKEYAKYLMGIGSVLALLAAAGDDDERGKIFGLSVPIELDPVSSDFLKVRFGNTRLDPFSGLLQITTVVERMRRRETKTAEGKLVPLSGDTVRYGGSTTTDVMFRFIRSKFAPAVGSFVDWREEKNVVGEKVTPKDVLLRGLVPISFGEILDTMKEQGIPRGTALSLLSMFGIGLQTYEPREKKTVRKAYEASKY